MISHVPVSCNRDCGGGCPLLAHVEDGRLIRITDNPAGGPYMRGCVRGYQMPQVLYAPDRLRRPLLRKGPRGSGDFQEVDWKDALDLVAERLADIRARHGAQSVLCIGGSGACRGALHNTNTLSRRFFHYFGGYTTKATGGYSASATFFAMPYVLGTAHAASDPGTLQHSGLIVLWGSNMADCILGCETRARIQEARRRGVEVIVIDPRRSRTAAHLGTEWIPILPGTDSALMLAVLYVLLTENLANRDFARRYSTGFDALERYVLGDSDGIPKTPDWAERICHTPADTIVNFARLYGLTHPTALLPGLSIQRTMGGEEAARLAIALQVATGNLGVAGGSTGDFAGTSLPGPRVGSLPVPRTPKQPSIPVYRWPDAVLEGKKGGYPTDIRAIYNAGSNYLNQGSDVHKNIRAFEALEFSVTHDYFLTPTARYSDVVLPVTTFLERQDIILASGNYVFFSHQAVAPLHEARNDYDIFCELAERLGFLSEFSEGKDAEAWLRSFLEGSEIPDTEAFRRTGIYMGADQCRVALSDFVADPDVHPLPTPSGRVEILSAAYEADTGYPALPVSRVLPVRDEYPLRLITPKSKYRVHSQHSNITWFKERERQAIWIHPQDASRRGITDGQPVLVTSPEGRVRIAARVTEDVTPGVVCLLEGIWPRFEPDGTDSAGSANVLTCTEPTLPSQGSRTHSVLVQVAPT